MVKSYWSNFRINIELFSGIQTSKPPHDKTNKLVCVPSEDSDQPGHPSSLIRVFAGRRKKAWVLSHPLTAQRRLWSDWAAPRLIWGCVGCTVILLVLSWGGSNFTVFKVLTVWFWFCSRFGPLLFWGLVDSSPCLLHHTASLTNFL